MSSSSVDGIRSKAEQNTKRSLIHVELIPIKLWSSIYSKLDSFWDRVSFRAVCRSWRSLVPPPRHPPCLFVDESKGQFMCLGKQKVYKLDFPEIPGSHCVGSVGSWILTEDDDKKIVMTNLFTRVQTHPVPDDGVTTSEFSFTKVVLSSPLCDGQSCSAVGVYQSDQSDLIQQRLAFARPGDTSWTTFREEFVLNVDIIFHKQQFYAIDMDGELMLCNFGDNLHSPTLSVINERKNMYPPTTNDEDDAISTYCLVEWLGELLVIQIIIDSYTQVTDRINVYMLDHGSLKLKKVKTLGEHSLFVGIGSTCVSVPASDYFGLVKQNCIYFIDRTGYGEADFADVNVFNMEDKSISTYYERIPLNYRQSWIIPA